MFWETSIRKRGLMKEQQKTTDLHDTKELEKNIPTREEFHAFTDLQDTKESEKNMPMREEFHAFTDLQDAKELEKQTLTEEIENLLTPTDALGIHHTYKDRLFRCIFNNKAKLLSLYNAIHGTHYKDEDAVEINTLDDVIYINMKNDISFMLDCNLNLYEHQSSWNPNMPLRGLFYFSKLYQKITASPSKKYYSSTLLPLPIPQYVVFYNGADMKEERTVLRLSDAFPDGYGQPCLEVETLVLNINYGKNKAIMEQCRPLMEYAIFVQKINNYKKQELSIKEAVNQAITDCINENIMKEFLLNHRLEVTEMSILEYTLQDFLEDRKQEQLENEELRLQLEKERKEKEAAIQTERKEKEAAIQAERKKRELVVQAERKEKEAAIFSLQKTIVLNMRKNNKSFEEIAQDTTLDIDMVRKLAEEPNDN